MKKTFKLTHPKIKYARLVDRVKNEVRKYLKRERKKELPEGADFLDFDCKFGDTEDLAKEIHLSEMDRCINDAEERRLQSFYVEILARPEHRTRKSDEEGVSGTRSRISIPEYKKFGGA